MSDKIKKHYSTADYLRFIIPSLIGILLFLTPLKYEGDFSIPVAFLSGLVSNLLEGALPLLVTIVITVSAIISILYKVAKPKFMENSKTLKDMFNPTPFWLVVRIVGMVLALLVYFEAGPEWIWNENTGGLLLYDLLCGLFGIFLFAAFFLSLLTDFGLLEFIGSLLTRFMRPVFKLPGRSAIDCIASWLGDGTIGVMLTNNLYEQGSYTTREASVIATTFSAVSITFSLVVAEQVDLANKFVPFYLAVTFAGIAAAIIVPRIPPLSRKPDDFLVEPKGNMEDVPEGYTPVTWGLDLAINKARESGGITEFITNGFKRALDMWFGVMPVIMAFGTIAVIIAEFTPVFVWLGKPFIPILNLLRIPHAVEASQTMIIGFADMFLPSVIAASIPSELTRFVVAGVSITQLIYLSEVGAVILGSSIPISLGELFIIFIERTLVTLPILAVIGHLLF
ncbi:MAG: YjiH family protein [Tissierellia bacterium]|nr:YjiH family protein [Tissierellia bacterium]